MRYRFWRRLDDWSHETTLPVPRRVREWICDHYEAMLWSER